MKPDAHMIITNLLHCMDQIRDKSDEELMAAFMDTEADPVIRDTAQVILEARAFIKADEPKKPDLIRRYICDHDGSMKLHPIGQWVNVVDYETLRSSVRRLVGEWEKQEAQTRLRANKAQAAGQGRAAREHYHTADLLANMSEELSALIDGKDGEG